MLKSGFLRFCDNPEIACCKAERELEQLRTENASLREQLAESQRREQAAVEFIKYLDRNYSGYMAEDERFAEWRGPQEDGKGEE